MLKVLARMATNALATSRIDRKSEVQREPRDNDQHDDWQGLEHRGSLNWWSLCSKKMRLAVK